MVESQNQFCGNITTSNECDTTFTVKIDPSLPVKRKTRFHDLCLPHEILRAIDDLDFQYCTPIQEAILSQVIDGVDAACQSQTGTGKSAAFLISILTRLCRQDKSVNRQPGSPRALILAPTRELVSQIEQDALDLAKHTSLIIASAFGGIAYQEQRKQFTRNQVDILVATPGRLLDFIKQKVIRLNQVQTLVIDEADRMLDMGFIPDIERIFKLTPFTRQTLFFSATMAPEITRITQEFLHNPVRVEVARQATTSETITQAVCMHKPSRKDSGPKDKRDILRAIISAEGDSLTNAIIFCNRKRDVDIVAKSLKKHDLDAAALHGDLDQSLRMKILNGFRDGELRLLVASDVAARGLDIPNVSHVFNFDVPIHSEDYVHRIGRTGR
ncbi:MAG: DEAD/DEAH box helicase, partial [Desulfobulbaceae bacterium]|nr:DEAD/DEAH box helicase [Desulfobulbaceae bacterium]